jgi:small-conductance mechanosensitive channel
VDIDGRAHTWQVKLTEPVTLELVGEGCARERQTARVLAWNALAGTLLLAVIVVVAIASLPLFHAYGAEPAHLNTWVAYFPFVWLPAALVSAALFGHVVLWRRLLTAPSFGAPTKSRETSDLGALERASNR